MTAAGADRRQESGDGDDSNGFARDMVTSVIAVVLVGAYLFAISGVWPPMVAIESGSMEPNMDVNDLAFIMETDRFQPDAAHENTGVVTATRGEEVGYTQFGDHGDVIVFQPNGNGRRTPIIHRAMFFVEEGENWFEEANETYLNDAGSCAEIGEACPAPHDGFITKGDNNPTYDQVGEGISEPVAPGWVIGTAEARIPVLGWLRLRL